MRLDDPPELLGVKHRMQPWVGPTRRRESTKRIDIVRYCGVRQRGIAPVLLPPVNCELGPVWEPIPWQCRAWVFVGIGKVWGKWWVPREKELAEFSRHKGINNHFPHIRLYDMYSIAYTRLYWYMDFCEKQYTIHIKICLLQNHCSKKE